MKVFIVIKLEVEGLHRWPQAAEIEPKVAFLSHPHRHIFHVKVIKQVNHDDRDIEIILFKRKVIDYLTTKYATVPRMLDFRSMSCEMIAEEILNQFECKQVEVLEDNENGAMVSK
jgi:hypothetical protein